MGQRHPSVQEIYETFHRPALLDSDPLAEVHAWRDRLGHRAETLAGAQELEAVAVLSALLAYGNVKSIRRSVQALLAILESRAGSVWAAVDGEGQGLRFNTGERPTWVHRFTRWEHIERLLRFMGRRWKTHGSLGASFLEHLKPTDAHVGPALDRWMTADDANIPFLMTRPGDGSVCKRWCMLLRWMGRRDPLDLGLWTEESPLAPTFRGNALKSSQLVMPLDTHVIQWAKSQNVLKQKTVGWKAALAVTDYLRQFDADDPVKFDFSICRMGMFSEMQKAARP